MSSAEAQGSITWSAWRPLNGSSRDRAIPASPGLYRARNAATGDVVYIGQTGSSLRSRLGMLCTCYSIEMPYRDPHTAAPTLWCLRDRDGIDFEVSTAPFGGGKVERLAREAVAITQHRVDHGRSPVANFGGGVAGYRLSSANNARLVAAGRRFRGGPDPTSEASSSVPVPGPLDVEATAADWLGLDWSPWVPIGAVPPRLGVGLYRIRPPGAEGLLYVGQGRIDERLRAHHSKRAIPGHRQAVLFSGDLIVSWVNLDVPRRALLELENDAIASHFLVHGVAPLAQFLG